MRHAELAVLLLVFGLTLVFLGQASFHRKETVQGFLKPDRGLARVAPQRSGTVVELFVKDSQLVETGQPLVKISYDEYLAARQEIVLRATVAGKVYNLHAELGSMAQANPY